MADSTTNITQLSASQSQKEVTANELFDATSVAMYGARNATTCSGLTWGYYGGRWGGAEVANGTLTLNADDTNYIVLDRSTGEVLLDTASSSDDLWSYPDLYAHLYVVNTGASSVTDYEDHRAGPDGIAPQLMIGSDVQAYDADLTTIAGLTATTDNFMQAKSSAWASRTPAQCAVDLQGAGLDVDMCGFRGVPQNSQSGNYTTVAADAGKHLLHPSGGGSGDTFTIDSNANVAYEVGTAITFVNMDSNAVSIAITSDTLRLAGAGTTGTRTLAQYGVATAVKVASTVWLISGTGLT